MQKSMLLLTSIVLAWSAPSFARPLFALDNDNKAVKDKDKAAVVSFLAETENLLPDSLKKEIKSQIAVRFTAMGSSTKLNPPPCKGDTEAVDHDLSLYGKHVLFGSPNDLSVEINKLFIPIITGGNDSAQKYNCGHGNMYRLALATILHETSHIYDLRTGLKFQEPFATEYGRYQIMCSDHTYANGSPDCAYFKQIKARVSDTRPYLAVIGWALENGMIKQRGLETSRTPDAYEATNQREHFAVNMEFFLLDPEYKCRRPLLYQYLSNLFHTEPNKNTSCEVETRATYSFAPVPINLDPKHVYQIHYLLAGKGNGMASKFGHSMYRIIGCAPDHQPGPECLNDTDYHYVVSFRANVIDMVQSNLRGMTGSYPSQLFLYPLYTMINEYTMSDSRDLLSYPLKLNEEQKDRFLNRVLELYWQYSGKYYFISNNCATESLYLMQSVFPDLQLITPKLPMPYGLVEEFSDMNLLDKTVMQDKSAYGVYFFPSFETQMKNLIANLKKSVNTSDIDFSFDAMEKMKTAGRKKLTASLVAKYPQSKRIIVGTMLGIEMKMKDRELSKLNDKMAAVLSDAQKGKYPEIKKVMDKNRNARIYMQPWKMTISGYGIAPMSDRLPEEQLQKYQNDAYNLSNEAAVLTEKVIPEDYKEVRSIMTTIQEYLVLLK